MAAPLPNSFLDSIDATIAGMHSGIPPQLLQHAQLAFATNITSRGGYPRTRPVWRKHTLTFTNGDVQTAATEAMFQGAAFHQGFGGNRNSLVASIGGKLFRYIPGSRTAFGAMTTQVQDISPPGPINNPSLDKAWMFQAEDFLLVFMQNELPIFFDGAASRRSLGMAGKELPPGTCGSYINGRVISARSDRQSWIAGDLVYSRASGTPPYNYRDSVLKITENIAILGGNAFAIPVNAGSLNAIFSVAVTDTSLGQGPIMLGTRNGIFSAFLPLDSTTWTTTDQPQQVISLPHAGPLSDGVTVVNSDAWYRAGDGFRSFQIARRDFNTWVLTPLSFEMDKILASDSDALLTDHFSSVVFKNRFIGACTPYRVEDRGVAFKGHIALDFNNISSLTTRSQPAYDGLWTGLPILKLLTGTFDNVDRAFAFALDGDNKICLYELMPDEMGNADWNGTEDVRPECWLVSNALFALEGYTPPAVKLPLKKLITCDAFWENLQGQVDFDTKYKTDTYPFWIDWKTYSLCATDQTCVLPACTVPPNLQPLFATFKRLPEPADSCSPATGRNLRTGYQVQIRLQWTGQAQLRKLLTWAVPIPETIPSCPTDEACVILSGCTEDYFTYSIQ